MLKGIIFDFNRTLYDPEESKLFDGVLEMLKSFKKAGFRLGLVTYGGQEKWELLDKLGLKNLLAFVRVTSAKNQANFSDFLREFSFAAHEVVVVGDLLSEEIHFGYLLGCHTVWLKRGKFASDAASFKPEFTITNILDLRQILEILSKS